MKRIVIISAGITLVLGGGLLFMNRNINETTKPTVSYGRYDPVKKVSTETHEYNTAPEVIESVASSTPVEPVINDTPAIPAARSYSDLAYIYFKDKPYVIQFINSLKDRFPEKFTPNNIEETFIYLSNWFSSHTWDNTVYRTFTWSS